MVLLVARLYRAGQRERCHKRRWLRNGGLSHAGICISKRDIIPG